MQLTEQRAKSLAKEVGYEAGSSWGSITGAVGAVGTAGAMYAGGTVAIAAAPLIAAGVGVGALGYLAGGFVGGIFGSWRAEKIVEVMLEHNAIELAGEHLPDNG
jgi:hypothetical protein